MSKFYATPQKLKLILHPVSTVDTRYLEIEVPRWDHKLAKGKTIFHIKDVAKFQMKNPPCSEEPVLLLLKLLQDSSQEERENYEKVCVGNLLCWQIENQQFFLQIKEVIKYDEMEKKNGKIVDWRMGVECLQDVNEHGERVESLVVLDNRRTGFWIASGCYVE